MNTHPQLTSLDDFFKNASYSKMHSDSALKNYTSVGGLKDFLVCGDRQLFIHYNNSIRTKQVSLQPVALNMHQKV